MIYILWRKIRKRERGIDQNLIRLKPWNWKGPVLNRWHEGRKYGGTPDLPVESTDYTRLTQEPMDEHMTQMNKDSWHSSGVKRKQNQTKREIYKKSLIFVSKSHHIQMDDDAPGNIVLLGEIVFVHHPRADPLQFLSWMGHSKFYVGTLHVIYRWHIWSTFGSFNIKWKSEGDILKAVA